MGKQAREIGKRMEKKNPPQKAKFLATSLAADITATSVNT